MSFNEQNAPLSELQRLRSYSRLENGKRESWDETCDRTLYSPHLGLKVLGKFTDEEMALIDEMQRSRKAFGSFRWLWIGGTEWVENPANYSGGFNCVSIPANSIENLAELMNLAMMGTGTGAVLELDCIAQLPPVKNRLNVAITGDFGVSPSQEFTDVYLDEAGVVIVQVGDSRYGWVDAYRSVIELATKTNSSHNSLDVKIDISCVRPAGTRLKGFGGVANPAKLPDMFRNMVKVLNSAVGRQMNSVEVCLLIDHASDAIVAGGIRRVAGIKQFSAEDELGSNAKAGLWKQNEQGEWYMPNPEYSVLTASNHTRVFHRKPSEQEIIDAVRKQYYSGEGAIQWASESIARANADLLNTPEKKAEFLSRYSVSPEHAQTFLHLQDWSMSFEEMDHRMQRYGLNPLTLAA